MRDVTLVRGRTQRWRSEIAIRRNYAIRGWGETWCRVDFLTPSRKESRDEGRKGARAPPATCAGPNGTAPARAILHRQEGQMSRVSLRRAGAIAAASIGLLAGASPPAHAQAPPPFDAFTFSANMQPLGFSARTVPLDNDTPGQGVFNTDLAFWGNLAAQGTYGGFRLLDISNPASPREFVNYTGCASPTGGQPGRRDPLEQPPDPLVELAGLSRERRDRKLRRRARGAGLRRAQHLRHQRSREARAREEPPDGRGHHARRLRLALVHARARRRARQPIRLQQRVERDVPAHRHDLRVRHHARAPDLGAQRPPRWPAPRRSAT
jgi:hypothetical protein